MGCLEVHIAHIYSDLKGEGFEIMLIINSVILRMGGEQYIAKMHVLQII